MTGHKRTDTKEIKNFEERESNWRCRYDFKIIIECNNLNSTTSEDIFYYLENRPESITRFELVESRTYPTYEMTVLSNLKEAV